MECVGGLFNCCRLFIVFDCSRFLQLSEWCGVLCKFVCIRLDVIQSIVVVVVVQFVGDAKRETKKDSCSIRWEYFTWSVVGKSINNKNKM